LHEVEGPHDNERDLAHCCIGCIKAKSAPSEELMWMKALGICAIVLFLV
jgi:hypothetical protein